MSDAATFRERQLLRWLLFAAAFVGLYVVMVRIDVGQRLDNLGFEGRKAVRLEVRRAATAVMRLTTPLLVVILCPAAVVVAIRERRPRKAVLVLGATGTTIIAARVLKDLLPRVDSLEFTYASTANTFPSGHAAVILVVALSVIILCPREWQRCATCWAATLLAMDLGALLGSGWHRPSDVLGGLLLAAAVMSLGMALLGPGPVISAPPEPAGPAEAARLVAKLAVVAVGSLVPLLILRNPRWVPEHPLHMFATALLVTNVGALSILWRHSRQLNDLGRAPAPVAD